LISRTYLRIVANLHALLHIDMFLRINEFRFILPHFLLPRILDNVEHVVLNREYMLVKRVAPNNNDIVLDVGACIGLYTAIAGRRSRHIVAVEPLRILAPYIKRNAELNNVRNLSIVNAAVAPRTGWCRFYIGRYLLNSSLLKSYVDDVCGVERVEEVRCISINTMLKIYRPTLVKLDVEGLELDLLKASIDALQSVEKLVIEVHTNVVDLNEVVNLLEELGYTIAIYTSSEEPFQVMVYAWRDFKASRS